MIRILLSLMLLALAYSPVHGGLYPGADMEAHGIHAEHGPQEAAPAPSDCTEEGCGLAQGSCQLGHAMPSCHWSAVSGIHAEASASAAEPDGVLPASPHGPPRSLLS